MFGIDTKEPIPPAYITDHEVWDHYVGQVWHGLLSFLDLSAGQTVIEIAPGSSVKIAAALALSRYQGDLYVLDASADVLDSLRPRYEALLPEARIRWIHAPLTEALESLPTRPNFVLASHILDDMLLFKNDKKSAGWASTYTHTPDQAVKESWQRLAENPGALEKAKNIVHQDILGFIQTINPACFVINQYPSSTLYDHGLAGLNESAFDIFENIKASYISSIAHDESIQSILDQNKNYGNKHIGMHVLNARYWLSCRFRKN